MQRTKSILTRLIAFDSTRHNEAAIGRYVRDLFASEGYRITEQPVPAVGGAPADGRVNLLIERGEPRLYFFGHLDTVNGSEQPGAWTAPPLRARERDGRIYGLGASDMKGGLAAMITAVLAADAAHIGLCLTCDEEGGFEGVKELVARGHEPLGRAELAVFAEPTDLEIVNHHRACIELQLVAQGRAAHAAMPDLGCDASRLFDCLRALGDRLMAELPPTAFNIGYFESGARDAINVVPERAEAIIDVRPSHELHALGASYLAHEIERCVAELGLTLRHRINIDMQPLACPPSVLGPLAAAVRGAGLSVRYGRLDGTSEAGEVSRRFAIPCANFGPGPAALSHQPDEHVDLEMLAQCRRVYDGLIRTLGEAP